MAETRRKTTMDEHFGHILGYRRITLWINHFTHICYEKKRAHRIMRKQRIHSVIRKKRKKICVLCPETTAEKAVPKCNP